MSGKLPARQAELLERVCLKRYTVTFVHYMGSFQPNESVIVVDAQTPQGVVGAAIDRSFRPSTTEALRSKGLVRYSREGVGPGTSILEPTRLGLETFKSSRKD
jgi:hypothetical protein